MASPKEHFDAARQWQEHYQKEVEDIGLNIPPPTLGQTTNDYRREMMRLLKKTFDADGHWQEGITIDGLKEFYRAKIRVIELFGVA